MEATIKLAKVHMTCAACPSQWDAWDVDGNYYYLRYRFGHGTIEPQPSPDPDEWPSPYVCTPIDEFFHDCDFGCTQTRGGCLDGCITLEEFLAKCPSFELADDVKQTCFDEEYSDDKHPKSERY